VTVPPFTVLHVCMGNICRSPMAERLLARAVRERVTAMVPAGGDPGALVHSVSAGTGGWHEGEEMYPPAARQLRARGADATGFVARRLTGDQIDGADLVLTATADQHDYVLALRPDAAPRTFVLGEFGRLLPEADTAALPAAAPGADAVYARGVALVAAVDAARAGAESIPADDLDDPWGRGDSTFIRIGDEIEQTVESLAEALIP
jgi:protein-tyrosine phosphatase